MKYLEDNKIKNEVIDKLIEELNNYEDSNNYGSELAYNLFESYNIDGSMTYNSFEAINWIKQNFEDLGEIVEEIKFSGLEIPNVFDEPEKFMVVIFLEVGEYLMGECDFVVENWNNEFELNK